MADTQILGKGTHQRRSSSTGRGHAIAKLKTIRCGWDHDADSPRAKRTIKNVGKATRWIHSAGEERVLPVKSGSNTVIGANIRAGDSVPRKTPANGNKRARGFAIPFPELSRAAVNSGTICFTSAKAPQ